MFKRILIATDGSTFSHKAADQAAQLAKKLGASIIAMTVADRFPIYLFPAVVVLEDADQAIESDCRKILSEVETVVSAAGVSCQTKIVSHDAPFRAIIDTAAAEACDLIVMGSHGRSGVQALLLGSVTQKVLAHATIPVLITR
jgi:nucleotide-binding universal stress UspA family protein